MTGKGGQVLEVAPVEDAEGVPPSSKVGEVDTEENRARKGISEFEFLNSPPNSSLLMVSGCESPLWVLELWTKRQVALGKGQVIRLFYEFVCYWFSTHGGSRRGDELVVVIPGPTF